LERGMGVRLFGEGWGVRLFGEGHEGEALLGG